MRDSRPVIHLCAPAGSCQRMMRALKCRTARELIELIQPAVGDGYRLAGDARLIEAGEDELNGGRADDARRAGDLQKALADERTVGIVSLRGGSWLTRILPRIDFDVLRARRGRVAVFGFSELTTLINIAATYPKTVCWYDMGPGFIPAGLQRWARHQRRGRVAGSNRHETQRPAPAGGGQAVPRWAFAEFPGQFASFFEDVVARIEGRPSRWTIRGRLVAGKLPAVTPARVVGGTLAVLVSLLGSPYAKRIFKPGRWLALEDLNELPHRLDRMLAHLHVAGVFERCAGLLLGDFHAGEHDRTPQVLASLKRMLPTGGRLPIVTTPDFGHTWPMAPLPINRALELRCSRRKVELAVPWKRLAS